MAKPPTRDFAKRPKAKVGKKAPKKINATDTSFKTASVAVKSQGQGLDKNKVIGDGKQTTSLSSAASRLELASSRGNTLSTLQLSLRHHAPAVRASGLKGIRDAVQSLSALDDSELGISILEANLPTLLPNMCRCWLDEDDDARGLAINLFGDILKNLFGTSSSNEQSDLKCLSPFVPFLCAYASSALNSLDRDIRKDGAKIVGMLSSSKPILSFSLLSTDRESDEGGGLSAMSIEMGSHVDLFIPSLERLLSSMSLGGRRGNNNASSKDGTKKRKRDGNSNASSAQTSSLAAGVVSMAASDATILSLGLLLQASSTSTESDSNTNITTTKRRLNPSLLVSGESTFLKGGSTHANALLLFREGVRGNNNKQTAIQSIWDLPSMPVDDLVGNRENMYTSDESVVPQQRADSTAGTDTSTIEKISSLNTLLETLRMKFVELAHSGRAHEKGGLIMPTTDLDTMDILVQTIRLTHQQCQEYLKLVDEKELLLLTQINARTIPAPRQSTKNKKKSKTKVQDIGECLASYKATADKAKILLLESFPICPMDNTSLSRYELTNAGICNTLAELGGGIKESSGWISSVFAYILPRLQTSTFTDDSDIATKNNVSEKIATNMLLKVVSKLLLSHSAHADTGESSQTYLLKDITKRRELLEAFASTFFVESGQVQQLSPTPMGRTAAMLLTSLVPQLVTDSADINDKCFVLRMMSVLPIYLVAWEGNYPIQTGLVLSSIISVVRQWNETHVPDDEIPINNLCLELRSKLMGLYITSKKKPSIFERLPVQVQKLCVGLIGLLKCPPGDLMKSLASICALKDSEIDTRISDSMSNYIMELVHSLRKTIAMPIYITFLIDSCGIKRASNGQELGGDIRSSPISETVFSYDSAFGQLCRFLITSCDKASLKVLPMIRPILQKWMENSSTSNDIYKQLVQARAAISILAAFTWDEVLSQGHVESHNFVGPVFLKLDDEFDSQLIDCIIGQFELSARIWSMEGGDYMDDLEVQQQYLARLLGPITLLLRYRKGVFDQFIKAITNRVTQQKETLVEETGKEDVSSSKQINVTEVLMKALLLVLKSKEPVSIVELVRDNKELQSTLLDAAEQIEKTVSGGHLSHLGNKIMHTVNLIQQ